MKEKKPVYNGYEERYATGEELSKLFEGQYLTTGRHHSVVLGLSIPDYLWFLGVDDQKIYRIFINQFFCRLMKGDTDGKFRPQSWLTRQEYAAMQKNMEDK